MLFRSDHVLISTGAAGGAGGFADAATIGHNFEAVIAGLETHMRAAAGDLDFEEAARLRDEIKRLRTMEMAVVDDPTVRNVMTAQDSKLRRATGGNAPRKPNLDEMGPGVEAIPSRPDSPRSTMGKPGMRGGFKKRGR